MNYRVAVISVILLSGCSVMPEVVPTGWHSYKIFKEQKTGFSNTTSFKQEVVSKAYEYCVSQDKDIQIESIFETRPPYVLGNCPRAEVRFKCLSPSKRVGFW